jgi:ABC-2 type transport system permease protein
VLLFPNWPQWIARIFPTYYIVNPVYRVSIFGESWAEIGWQVYVLIGFVLLFFIPVALLARRVSR